MREIGSEFEYNEKKLSVDHSSFLEAGCCVFSGRTAIETVLKNEKNVQKALLPSYCCDSMIEPFRQAGIIVEFFSVTFEESLKIDLNISNDVDCVLWCNYFGFAVEMPNMSKFLSRGGIVIEDITHSFYSKEQSHEQSTYLVASLRKWEPIFCGGYVESKKGELINRPLDMPSVDFLEKRKKAMKLKADYLAGDSSIDKSIFLSIFSGSNEWLAENYSGLIIDDYSKEYIKHVDIERNRNQRIRNAKILYEGLMDNPDIQFLFPLEVMDCPLFVPVIIKEGKRNAIKNKLIDHGIYCSAHWPHPEADCESNLYNIELSLICDQRYDEDDMQRIVSVLNN